MIYVCFKHLSLEEREIIAIELAKGNSLRSIAKKLDRSHTSLSRELKRNTKYGKTYMPCLAQKRAVRIGNKQRFKAPLKNPQVFLYVREHLRSPHFWSPEMISGRIGYDIKGASISVETIYRHIYKPSNHKSKLWEFLPCGRKKRKPKKGRSVRNNSKIPYAVSIDLRPKSIAKRKAYGHWETDNVEGPKTSKPALSVSVERAIRFVTIRKVKNKSADEKLKALNTGLSKLPQPLRLSITQDNGSENTNHQAVAQLLGTQMFFCHPYHSWEKGSVENRNKIIRRFFPKGTDFTYVTTQQIQFVEHVLNNMPLKCLNFKKPCEIMSKVEKRLNQSNH